MTVNYHEDGVEVVINRETSGEIHEEGGPSADGRCEGLE